MNSSINSAMQAYKEVYTEVAAETADPHKLVSMLFNGVSDRLCTAEQGFENGDLKVRGRALPKRRPSCSDYGQPWILKKEASCPAC